MPEQPLPDDRFPRTPSTETTAELIVKKSRFLAFLAPCRSKEEALSYLHVLKQTYWDAAHHCYAYRIGPDGMEYRMSDDGEPSGTAGKPLLFGLQKARLTYSIIVVVRYFGGVKLGVGPLARAYADAAQLAVDGAEVRPLIPMSSVEIHCMYDDISLVIDILDQAHCSYETTYADAVSFHVQVPLHDEERLTLQIVERTHGRAGFSKIST